MELSFTLGVFWYVAFIVSTVLHEAAHALVAQQLGDDTAKSAGQLTIDPYPHMKREPFGMIILPIVSFITGGVMIGWASVPYNAIWASQYPKRAAMMSLAGPVTNLLLSIFSAVLLFIGLFVGVFEINDYSSYSHIVVTQQAGIVMNIASLLSIMFVLNLCLFIFNMLPVPPLDGSSAIALLMKPSSYDAFKLRVFNPRFHIFGLMIALISFDLIAPPVLNFAVRLIRLAG